MIMQRTFFQTEVQSLHSQNTVLRQRVRKIGEIQSYVEILLQNNKKYQDDIKTLQNENLRLRGKMDEILEQSLLIKEAHNKQISLIKNGFESDIQKLVKQLKGILDDKQQMQNANSMLMDQLTTRFRKQLEIRKRQIEELETQSSRRINKLNQSIKSKQRVIQQITWEYSQKQKTLAQQVQRLANQIAIISKDKDQLINEVDILENQKRSIIKKYKELQKQNEDISTKFLKNDQQKSQTMLHLKNKNTQLIKLNQELDDKNRVQQKTINEQVRKINHLIKQSDEISNLKNQVQASLRRNLRSFQDLKAQHSQVVSKLDYVSKTSEAELKKRGQQIQKLSEENKKLNRENLQINSENKDKLSQIQQLIRAIEKLQRKINDINENNLSLENQNFKINNDNKNLKQTLQETQLERKSLSEKVNLYSNHNSTLEELLEKQKRKNHCLETSRFQIQTIAMGALSKPEQICKQYERQIEKIIQQFVAEKRQIELVHISEMQKLKAAYEEALKQKEQYFNRKILFLEKQIINLRPLK